MSEDESTRPTNDSHRDHPRCEHGRFLPGARFGKRYRIVGLLGRGGMGEVYHADDLELGQAVALKLLPDHLSRDQRAMDLLRNEVRLARQVSHPNVCRVYDVGEIDGQIFLSMEYVDGEDLAALLRRIGRLPQEKGLDLAHQLCAGLAASHDLGMLHRDLKPANIIVDGRGRLRIVDFGVAALAAGPTDSECLAGTPAYMAPEQLAGEIATVQSDVYAVGLVLYEIFTGKKAFREQRVGELLEARRNGLPSRLTDATPRLDPVIERAVLHCLEPEPEQRPATIRAVAAALPGGDPLAAARAAGETPSPGMVAAAGGRGGMRPLMGLACLAALIAGIATVAITADEVAFFRLAPLESPPSVLAHEARKLLEDIGLRGPPADHALGIMARPDDARYLSETDPSPARWYRLREGRRGYFSFWYRESPWPLRPEQVASAVTHTDPPDVNPGMAEVHFDREGHLTSLDIVRPGDPVATEVDSAAVWSRLFRAAGLDPRRARPVSTADWERRKWLDLDHGTPRIMLRRRADLLQAWIVALPESPSDSCGVLAAGYRGLPVFFLRTGTDIEMDATHEAPTTAGSTTPQASGIVGIVDRIGVGIDAVTWLLILVGAPWMARRNLRAGRGDRRGAWRFGAAVVVMVLIRNLSAAHYPGLAGREVAFIQALLGEALVWGALLGLGYLAIEPHFRRHWPETLISWSRLMSGRLGDPRVGRDLVVGLALGAILEGLARIIMLSANWFDLPVRWPITGREVALLGGWPAAGHFFDITFLRVSFGLFVLPLLALTMVLRRRIPALIALSLFLFLAYAAMGTGQSLGPSLIRWSLILLGIGFCVLAFARYGLLSLLAAGMVMQRLENYPVTIDLRAWYGGTSGAVILVLFLMAVAAHVVATRRFGGSGSLAPEHVEKVVVDSW